MLTRGGVHAHANLSTDCVAVWHNGRIRQLRGDLRQMSFGWLNGCDPDVPVPLVERGCDDSYGAVCTSAPW